MSKGQEMMQEMQVAVYCVSGRFGCGTWIQTHVYFTIIELIRSVIMGITNPGQNPLNPGIKTNQVPIPAQGGKRPMAFKS